jgi:predicted Zn-dependent peptidase
VTTAVGRTVPLDTAVVQTTLPGGPVVLSETVPHARSVAVGVWVRWGAAHEPADRAGAAHFLEHVVFKGTERRSAREIAAAIEGLGGSLDAYTAREHTLYQARVLGEHLGVAVDVLADLVFHPRIRPEDVELERGVILEEIAGVEDTPEDWVFDLHAEALWGGHPYGRPILGTRESVRGIGPDDLAALWAEAYRATRCVVTAAGRVEHEALLEEVARRFPQERDPAAVPATPAPDGRPARERRVVRDTAQVHLCAGARAFPYGDARRYALEVATTALGGGMSSRLFQRVREELGLAYAVYAFESLYRAGGIAGVYAGTHPAHADRTLATIAEELDRARCEPWPEAELEAARRQVTGRVRLALESVEARMHRLARFPLYDEPYVSVEDELARIEAVGAEDVRAVCEEVLAPERWTVARLGPESANP